jgi:hypothetical protein
MKKEDILVRKEKCFRVCVLYSSSIFFFCLQLICCQYEVYDERVVEWTKSLFEKISSKRFYYC